MGYGRRRYGSAEEFLGAHASAWVAELHQVLAELLDRARTVLSIGSGECEHELPFVLDGYQILATDLVESAQETQRLFPVLRFSRFDVFHPAPIGRFDDVLVTGLDFYFSDREFAILLCNIRSLLNPGGRLIFTLRYRDNLGTWLIDRLGIPLCCVLLRGIDRVTKQTSVHMLKPHGFRRSLTEIRQAAMAAGFRIGRIRHAGFGVELTRIYLHRLPALYRLAAAIDRRLHVFNNATVFELLT